MFIARGPLASWNWVCIVHNFTFLERPDPTLYMGGEGGGGGGGGGVRS